MINHAPSTTDAKMVVDALIDALRLSRPTLNDKCSRALSGLGGRAIPLFLDVANDKSTRRAHRRRLQVIIASLDDSRPIDDQAGLLIMQALLECLRIYDRQLNDKATAALKCLRPPPIDRLILEALSSRQQPATCARLLQAAAQFGVAPRASRHQDLFDLAADKNADVRAAADRLISQFRLAKKRSQKRADLSA